MLYGSKKPKKSLMIKRLVLSLTAVLAFSYLYASKPPLIVESVKVYLANKTNRITYAYDFIYPSNSVQFHQGPHVRDEEAYVPKHSIINLATMSYNTHLQFNYSWKLDDLNAFEGDYVDICGVKIIEDGEGNTTVKIEALVPILNLECVKSQDNDGNIIIAIRNAL